MSLPDGTAISAGTYNACSGPGFPEHEDLYNVRFATTRFMHRNNSIFIRSPRRRGDQRRRYLEIVPAAARIALECIGNSDALYHNVEHTLLVTLAGHDILRGRALHTHMTADDYAHVVIACLTHDIGYVRG